MTVLARDAMRHRVVPDGPPGRPARRLAGDGGGST